MNLNSLINDHFGYFLVPGNQGIIQFKITHEILNCINRSIELVKNGNKNQKFFYELKNKQSLNYLLFDKIKESEIDSLYDQFYCKETDSNISVVELLEEFPIGIINYGEDESAKQTLEVYFEVHEGQYVVFATLRFDHDSEDDFIVFTVQCKHLFGIQTLSTLLNKSEEIITDL